MAARWACETCGSPWAPGAPCCPRCRGTEHIEDAEAPDVTLKTNRQGIVTDSADVTPDAAALEETIERDEAELAELEGEQVVPVAETAPAPAADPPAAPRPPRVPPRRTPPPGADGG